MIHAAGESAGAILVLGLLCLLAPIIDIALRYGLEDDAVDRWWADQSIPSLLRWEGMVFFGLLLIGLSAA